MIGGLETALGEITLVLFTTLAPSGTVAFIIMSLVLLCAPLDEAARRRINQFLCIPLVVTLVGLVASATHLGNPANALYVLLGVGRSPLSNEVFAAVFFLGLAGTYWLISFSEAPRVRFQKGWLIPTVLAGLVLVSAIAFAYAADTIISWNTVYVPLSLWLNALVGGPILALASLRIAHFEEAQGVRGRILCLIAVVALLANIIGYVLQNATLASTVNSFASAADMVPYYPAMIAGFGVLAAAGIVLAARPCSSAKKRYFSFDAIACVLVFAGIFIMRFGFYMMYLTAGISF
ncbi:MAG: DmsC/YnfH family molybdoenzyme membrane anchor subunit [Raoultibacter sp.]